MSSTTMRDNIKSLSSLGKEAFVRRLGGVFEHSPWVAERAWDERPFSSIDELHAAMVAAVDSAPAQEQLALICAHPELAGKEASSGRLTKASTGEQKGAGLDQCSADELARLRRLNADYRQKMGFPFVIAVKGLSRYQIMDAIETRLQNDRTTEHLACLEEIAKIARFRLQDLIA
ncbi:2-oxo-4-hydroxy-4-carboxy-5-ureidoimidazoline decarboxylase [Azoarcus sp. L1K30]|uniref:2-oxo-4-hydroxy-4-carboxy-5-ureidoimidazoline decarboxylase n=1 Tax=Azoarcus sp. L1K30 TaxID=2820277 RepID=UPI001B833154|nr:2-oxo-4-hydroxy-4-carboxy-5-ureidoimidazoline decarboxylase [Azoarcus sp. L1K30]MBR0566205.1 2-oxo-4-hydroxy-4-carboxy-5-ureidoimidazoline decarboxylase [Azoarcus sp. L1K30]